MTLSPRSLSNSEKNTKSVQIQNSQDKVTLFLEREFRVSQSLSTKNSYNSAIRKFIKFLEIQYGFGLLEILKEMESKNTDPVDVLDDFYSFLTQYKRENSEKIGYSNHTICDYIIVTKEFLNGENWIFFRLIFYVLEC